VLLAAAALVACGGDGSSRVSPGTRVRVEMDEHLRRGIELARQGQDEGAEAEFRRCVALDPGDARSHLHLGRALASQAARSGSTPREAAAELQKAVELAPGDLVARVDLAEILRQRFYNLYDPNRAVELYEGVLRDNPDLADVRLIYASWLGAGDIRLTISEKSGRVTMDSAWTMEAARRHVERVIDQVPPESGQAAAAHRLMAIVFMRSGAWPESVRECDLLLGRFPDLPAERRAEVLGIKGHGQYRQGLYAEALASFRARYDLAPSDWSLWDIYQASLGLGGYPADLPRRYRFPLRPEPSGKGLPAAPKFRDIAPQLGIDKYAGAGPASWGDYDGDGLFDLLVCGCDTFCSLYKNEGQRFTDVTLQAGLGNVESGFGAPWGDYDGDGWPDLYIARNGWSGPAPDSLYRNRGDGTFEDVTPRSGISEPGSGFHAAWLDYDRDGWLDLFVSNGVTIDPNINHLYHNKGDGTFEDVTAAAGLTEEPKAGTIGVAIGDYDGDGWPDIFVNGRKDYNRLYRNRGDGTFAEVAREAGVQGNGRQNGFVALFADLDSDGDLDILGTSLALWDHVVAGYRADYKPSLEDDLPRLYRNDGGGRFTDISDRAGFLYPLGIMAANVADLDNDGYADIYFGTGDPDTRRLEPNILYMNTGRGTFVDRTRSAAVGTLGKGHGITFVDWDGDGDLEMYAQLGGFFHGDLWHSAFFLNETPNRNHYLAVDLRQDGPNRLAVGAGVTVKAGALTIYQEVAAGRGFGSSDPPTLHFGLGQNRRIDRLRVRWPDGTATEYPPPPVDRRILIRRGEKTWITASPSR
jgi:tetratricopeptide (TPR) repeat protein